MGNLGSFSVDIRAGIATLQSDLGKGYALFEKNAKQMQQAAERAGKIVGAGIAAGAAGFAVLARQAINTADSINDMAKRTGVSVESLSRLQVAAKLSDTSLGTLQTGFGKLAKAQTDAARGGKEQIALFEAMSIQFKNADGTLRDSEKVLLDVADVFKTLPDGAEKTALALKLLGRGGQELIPLLSEGSAELQRMGDTADALGITLSKETAAAAAQFNDQMDLLGLTVDGLGTRIATGLLPQLNEFAAKISSDEFRTGFASIAEGAVTATLKTIDLIAKVGELARFGGEEVAARVNGPSSDDIVRIEQAVERQQALMDQLDQKGGLGAQMPNSSDYANEQRAQLIRLRAELESATKAQDDLAVAQAAAGAAAASQAADINNLGIETKATTDGLKNYLADQTAAAEAASAAAKAASDAAKAKREEDKAIKEVADRHRAYAEMVHQSAEEERAWLAEQRAQQAQFDAQARDLQNEIRLLSVSGDARRDIALSLEAERLARDSNGEVVEKERKRLEELLKVYEQFAEIDSIAMEFDSSGFDELIEKIEKMGDALKKATDPETMAQLQESIGNARQEAVLFATDAISQGISSLQNLATEGSSAYKALEVAQAAANVAAAIGAIVNQGMGDPYTAFARMAAMAAAVGALVGSLGGFSGGGPSSQSAEVRQEQQGTGTVLGDAEAKSESILNAMEITADATSELVGINRGMLRALQTLESGIGSATGMIARGGWTPEVGNLDSGGLLGLPTLGLANAIFGGKEELIDQGIVIAGGALNDMLTSITIGAYNTIETDGGWFHSDDTDTNVTDITDQFGDQFALIIESIANTVREGATALGLLPADIEAAMSAYRVEEIRISLMGLDAEEQQAELAAVFSSIFDGLAGSVAPFIEQFQQLGEGLGETLVRVATSVQVTQEAMLQLGFALDQTDPELFAQIAVGLIDMSGGIEEFIEGMQSFVSNFASEAHQFAVAQDALNRAFAQSGLVVPATREGMWELMQSLDATTESGREQIATLLRLAGVSDAYYDGLESQAEAAAEAAEVAAQAVQDQLDAMRAYADTVTAINRALYEESGATEYRQSLASIREQYTANVAALTSQAVAAGLTSARSEDLTAALQLQTRQMARATAELRRNAAAQAESLGYTPLGMVDSQIAALQESEAAAAQSMQNLGDSIQQMSRIASDVASAMLGEFGPLDGQAKADYALQALRDGAISLDAALNAGRDVFSSGRDFNEFFQQAIGIAQNRPDETQAGGGGTGVSAQMRELLKEQARLQAEGERASRYLQAQDFVSTIADLSFGEGTDYQTVLDSLGVDLESLLRDLGFTEDTQLGALITQMQGEQNSLSAFFDTMTADGVAIVEELRAIYERGEDPLFQTPEPAPVPEPITDKDPPWEGGAKSMQEEEREDRKALLERVDILTATVERLLATTNSNTGAAAVALQSSVQIQQRQSMSDDQATARAKPKRERVG